MDITLILNEYDLSDIVSDYLVTYEPVVPRIVTTMDHVEHFPLPKYRVVIRFTLFPMDDTDTMDVFNTLSDGVLDAIYTDPYNGGSNRQQDVRLVTDLSATFSIKSTSGVRYYTGSPIELRAIATGFGEEPQQND